MREILFKAKRIDNCEWIEGLVTKIENAFCLIRGYGSNISYECDVNTLCQYTGLADKNGNKIWENDLIECKEFSDGHLKKHFLSQVEWDDTGTGFTFKYSNNGWVFTDSLTVYECEVIGNIFDNPELLKGSEEE